MIGSCHSVEKCLCCWMVPCDLLYMRNALPVNASLFLWKCSFLLYYRKIKHFISLELIFLLSLQRIKEEPNMNLMIHYFFIFYVSSFMKCKRNIFLWIHQIIWPLFLKINLIVFVSHVLMSHINGNKTVIIRKRKTRL